MGKNKTKFISIVMCMIISFTSLTVLCTDKTVVNAAGSKLELSGAEVEAFRSVIKKLAGLKPMPEEEIFYEVPKDYTEYTSFCIVKIGTKNMLLVNSSLNTMANPVILYWVENGKLRNEEKNYAWSYSGTKNSLICTRGMHMPPSINQVTYKNGKLADVNEIYGNYDGDGFGISEKEVSVKKGTDYLKKYYSGTHDIKWQKIYGYKVSKIKRTMNIMYEKKTINYKTYDSYLRYND